MSAAESAAARVAAFLDERDKAGGVDHESIHTHNDLELTRSDLRLLIAETQAVTGMWINAFKLVRPSDEFVLAVGRDVVNEVKASMRRERTDPLEPIGLARFRIVAS
jgi:hypothetical protein